MPDPLLPTDSAMFCFVFIMIDGVKWNTIENLVNNKIYLIYYFSLISEVSLTYKEIRLIWFILYRVLFITPQYELAGARLAVANWFAMVNLISFFFLALKFH